MSGQLAKSLKVRGLIVTSPRNVQVKSFEVCSPDADYVAVRIDACGLCTWEQRAFKGTKATYPFWGGHEVCGVVQESDGSNSDLKNGDRVALALMRRCGRCYLCTRGLDNHCAYVSAAPVSSLPVGPRGLSDFMLVPRYQVFPLGPDVSAVQGTLVEPIACILRSLANGGMTASGTAVVLGSGTMGLLHAALLKRSGCQIILCGDESDRVRAVAAGADFFLQLTSSNLAEVILEMTQGHGPDAVFCTRGGVAGIALGVKVVARGGRVVLYQSVPGPSLASVCVNDLHYREIQVVGTISQTLADFQQAVQVVSADPSRFDFLATEKASADDGAAAFELAIDPSVNRVMVSF